jgi:hypothetical protein
MPSDPSSADSRPKRRVDRVLDPAYLEDLDARSLEELRAMKQVCAEIETEFSYVRRLAQGRIDILVAEAERRASGGSVTGARSDEDLVATLTEILADRGPRADPAATRLSDQLAPSMDIQWKRGLERLVSDSTLVDLPSLSDAEIAEALAQLRELESQVSATRRSLHEVIDTVERDLAQRLAVGQP